jgi:hypothetical protein
VIDQLRKKINAYEIFNDRYPGFAGFLTIWDEESKPKRFQPNNEYQINVADSGTFIWGLVAVVEVLRNRSDYGALGQQYANYVDMLANNAIFLLCEKDCGRRPVFHKFVIVRNISDIPSKDLYTPVSCFSEEESCYLDGPWTGEHAFYFLYLYANWSGYSDEIKTSLLEGKRSHTRSREFESDLGNITVLEALTNSYDEKVQYLFLPNFDVEVVQRVFLNGERARLLNSTMDATPGLWESPLLPSIRTEKILRMDQYLSPTSASYLFLHNSSRPVAMAWIATMLKGGMQTRIGSRERIRPTG